jgi:hypothetical protein
MQNTETYFSQNHFTVTYDVFVYEAVNIKYEAGPEK